MKNILLASSIFLFSFTCSYNSPEKKISSITPPLKHETNKGIELTINPLKDTTITLQSNSFIYIPKETFVDEEGNTIKETVQINYKEYRTIGEIILSGIPMEYDSSGQTYNFESAGMIDIRGFCREQEVFIAKDKSIEIELASLKSEIDFNTYTLNEETGKWTYIGEQEITKNEAAIKLEAIEKSLKDLKKPQLPGKPNKNSLIIQLRDMQSSPKGLKEFNGLLWEYLNTDANQAVLSYQNLQDEPWECKDLVMKDPESFIFSAFMENGGNTKTIDVKPILTGKNFEKAKAKFSKIVDVFRAKKKRYSDQQKVYEKDAIVKRSFQVNNFGIINCDKPLAKIGEELMVELILPGTAEEPTIIYSIRDKKTVVKYYPNRMATFKYDKNQDQQLIAFFPNGDVGYIKDGNMRNTIQNSPDKKVKLHLTKMDEDIENANQIDNIIS